MKKSEFAELGKKILTSSEIIESLRGVESDPCPICLGDKTLPEDRRIDRFNACCTWGLIDKYLIKNNGFGLREVVWEKEDYEE